MEDQAALESLGFLIADLAIKAFTGLFRLLALPFRARPGHPKPVAAPPNTTHATNPTPWAKYPAAWRAPVSYDPQPPPPPPTSAESYEAGVARIAARMPYRKSEGVLTRGEQAFWYPLQQAIGSRYLILCKVRLADVAYTPDHRSDEYRRFRDIGLFHLDFVLCHPRTTAPLLVIELDDRSHGTTSALKRDRFKDAVLRAARLPIYRVPCQEAYAPAEIAAEVARRLS